MHLGMIGLGRMGANMARRLDADGHSVVGFDVDATASASLEEEGVLQAAPMLEALVDALVPPRVIWVMIPAAFVSSTVNSLVPLLTPGDVIIDGGNSYFRDSYDRAEALQNRGIHHVDVGVSGGVWGLERGYCLMVGGESAAVERLRPIFDSLSPGLEAALRTEGRSGEPAAEERGWLHCGPPGAGHFVKMVHNGIEYGLMAAYAEGFAILEAADAGNEGRERDAGTTPLRDPRYYRYDFDLPAIAELWRRGSVVGSWLLDLTARALASDPTLDRFEGRVGDSGEGRWTVQTAIDEGVPANVLAAALNQRFSSRGLGNYGDRLLSAMREQFGGHQED
ncbi:MAG: phosphogluconate dehydrogenase (NAD(+)-dependent, decarboxylating) [Acidimicrobiia bacterium]